MSALLHLGEIIAINAKLFPDKIGARDLARSLTFRAWNERSCRLANALLGLGLEQGDRIAILAYNCLEWMEIYAAIAKAALVIGADQFPAGRIGDPVHRRKFGSQSHHRPGRSARSSWRQSEPQRLIPEHKYIHFGGRTPAGYRSYEDLIAAARGV